MQTNPRFLPSTSILSKTPSRPRDEKSFRWQVIPATLSYFVALSMLTIAVLSVFAWIEYLHSDRYDSTRSLDWTAESVYWNVMETSIIPISIVASLIAFAAGWSWTREPVTTSCNLVLLSVFVFAVGFAIRV